MEETTEAPAKKARKKKFALTKLHIAIIAFVLGMLALFVLRYATLRDASVHYHANFALYINGKKDDFKSFTFYEEVQACSVNDPNNVATKVHMHDENPSLVHVHAAGITWGQFFANLNYGLSNKAVTTDSGVYVDGQDGNKLKFILNDQPVSSVANQVIKSEDVLLVNYGKEDNETIQNRASSIPHDAREANTRDDPGTCSGSPKLTTADRLKAALGINQPAEHHH